MIISAAHLNCPSLSWIGRRDSRLFSTISMHSKLSPAGFWVKCSSRLASTSDNHEGSFSFLRWHLWPLLFFFRGRMVVAFIRGIVNREQWARQSVFLDYVHSAYFKHALNIASCSFCTFILPFYFRYFLFFLCLWWFSLRCWLLRLGPVSDINRMNWFWVNNHRHQV